MLGLSRTPQQRIIALENEIKSLEDSIDPNKGFIRKHAAIATANTIGGAAIGSALGEIVTVVASKTAITTVVPAFVVTGLGVASTIALSGGFALAGAIGWGLGRTWWTSDSRQASNRKKAIKRINFASKELLDAKLDLLRRASPGTVIDFEFNRETTVEQTPEAQDEEENSRRSTVSQGRVNTRQSTRAAQQAQQVNDQRIEYVKLDDNYFNDFLTILRNLRGTQTRVKIRKIDISNAELTPDQLRDLMAAGLGDFETEELCLRNDNHKEEILLVLKKGIVENKNAFQKVKKLNLSGNYLDGNCLVHIREIVDHLHLDELDLSENPILGSQYKLVKHEQVLESETALPLIDFLDNDDARKMPSLKKLNLVGTGVHSVHAHNVASLIANSPMLEALELNSNGHLRLSELIDEIKEKGTNKALSLKKINTDFKAYLDLNAEVEGRNQAFVQFERLKPASMSRIIYLINSKLHNRAIPESVKSLLETTRFNDFEMQKIIESIQDERTAHLGVPEKAIIDISERELISYFLLELPDLYHDLKNKLNEHFVSPQLILAINTAQTVNKTEAANKEQATSQNIATPVQPIQTITIGSVRPDLIRNKSASVPAPQPTVEPPKGRRGNQRASTRQRKVEANDPAAIVRPTEQLIAPTVLNQYNNMSQISLRESIERDVAQTAAGRTYLETKKNAQTQVAGKRFRV